MVQLNSLRILCETKEMFSITSKLLDVAVGYFHIVYCVVGDNILVEFSTLKTTCAGFAAACLPRVQTLEERWLGLSPLKITPRKIHLHGGGLGPGYRK